MTQVHPLIRQMTEQVIGGAPFKIGDVVRHPDGRLVQITGGQYWGEYGLSNFWFWKAVGPDGQLNESIEHGYGWDPNSVLVEEG